MTVEITDDGVSSVESSPTVSKPEGAQTGAGPKKPVTFEDLEDATFGSANGKPAAAKKQGKAQKEDDGIDDELEDIEDDLEDLDDDIDDLEDDEDSDEEDEDSADSEDDEEEKESDDDEEKKDDDFEPDGYDDAKFKVKVNGKVREFTGKQMKTLVASGAHLHEQREAFKAQVSEMQKDFISAKEKLQVADNTIAPIWNAIKAGKVEDAVIAAAELKGINKLEARRKLVESIAPLVIRRLGLTPEQVGQLLQKNEQTNAYLDQQEEIAFLREQGQKPKQDVSKSEEDAADKEVLAFQKEEGVSDSELRSTVEWLKENTYKGKESEISLDVVRKTVQASRRIDKAFSAIDAVRPGLKSNDRFVDRVCKFVRKHPDLPVGRVARWVEKQARQFASTTRETEVTELRKDLSRKVQKSGNQSAVTKTPRDSQKRKPVTFAELEDDSGLFS